MIAWCCAFCGAPDTEGRSLFGALNGAIGICRYSARAAVRWYGEIPDPSPSVVALRPRAPKESP